VEGFVMFDRFAPRYLIPNGVTALSMVFAALAILLAGQGQYETALWLLVWSVLLDRVDGVAARMFHAFSAFGAQFDSLADMLAFCVAPPVVVLYLLAGDSRHTGASAGGLAWVALVAAALVYMLCGACRLARFNIESEVIGHRWFRGLPTPIAAAILVTYVLTAIEFSAPVTSMLAFPVLMLGCAVLMVSSLWLPKFAGVGAGLLVPGVVVIYGLGFTRHYPVLLLCAALAYPIVGFSVAPILRRRVSASDDDLEHES
jgi:CDP-diacylglycerol---serine O-phosphatidyltransferase